MTEAEAREALRELRLRLKASRRLVRELATSIARGEDALEVLFPVNAQPKEAQRDQDERENRRHERAGVAA